MESRISFEKSYKLWKFVSGIVIITGCLVLFGWAFDISLLKNVVFGFATMKPNTAFCFVLCGVSNWILSKTFYIADFEKRITQFLAILILFVSILTLTEYIFKIDLFIDHIFFNKQTSIENTAFPGRMSEITAISFWVLGFAFLLRTIKFKNSIYISQWLALSTVCVSFIVIICYVFNVQALYKIKPFETIAIHTAILFELVSLSLLTIGGNQGITEVFFRNSPGGIMNRRLFPVAVFIPLFLGWLFLKGENAGLYGNEFAMTLFVTANALFFTVFIWVSGVFLDKSDKELQIKKLEANKLASIVEFSDDAIISKDFEGTILSWNKSAERILGYRADEVIGKNIKIIFPPELLAEEDGILEKIRRGEHIAHFETVRRKKDGSDINVSLTVSPIRDESGEIVGISKIARDITLQKITDKKIHESEHRFRNTLDAMLEGVQIIDFDWRYIYVNETLAKHAKYTKEELIGHTVMEKFPGIEKTEVFNHYQRCFTERIAINVENEFTFPDNSKGWFELSFQPVPEGIFIHSVDITKRKLQEVEIQKINHTLEQKVADRTSELNAVNKELEAFSFSVSHDLRAPLRAMDGFSVALLEDYAEQIDETGKDYLNRIRNASKHLAHLIDDLLRLSRVTRSEIIKTEVDLSSLAKSVATNLQTNNPRENITFEIEENIQAFADERLITIALENLLGNAYKFTSKKDSGKIIFGQQKSDKGTEYFIKDNGAGFDMTFVNKLFTAFQRLHSTSDFEGTGIGLATVQRIIRKHGGDVRAEGELDKGACFYFSL